ncbi:mitotic deacetylase associated SANT domain protein a isoform X2 [Salminus brasiliensis]|uniref:mitotic deacetylase associated SANT domain protein a isoform X2 n=1 Tax=Salminus brasiliensis TaxID=930266 RepID=UPI003B8333E4
MSLSPHQRGNISNAVKQNIEGIEEVAQHSGDAFYNAGAPSLEQTHSSAGARVGPSLDLQGSAVFKPEKAYQVWGHFQQSGPVKWVHQEPAQASTWFQGVPNPTKHIQNVVPPLSGFDDARAHQALHKTNHDMDALQQEKMPVGSSVSFSESSQALAPGMEWDHHTMAAMHQAQFQALQQGHKPADPQYQHHAMRHAVPDSTLQPFQMAFGPTKQPQTSGVFQAFHSNSASQNLGYSEQPKSQQQLLHLQQQHLQHQHQMQQLQQMQQQQMQQQRLHQMQQQQQQQYHHQQKFQQMQQMQKQQQLQSLQQPETFTSQIHQQDRRPLRSQQLDDNQLKVDSSASSLQRHLTAVQAQNPSPQSPVNQDPEPSKTSQESQETQVKPEFLPRRSRRLSKDGLSPLSSQPPKEPAHNGGMGGQGPSGGVIQSTQRRRRASKEINLETLAQKASEMEFLPAKRDEGSGRQAGMLPLVIPVSVPVRRSQAQTEQAGGLGHETRPFSESVQQQFQYDRKPSVIVARRRSLRNSTSDSFNQDEEKEDGKSSDKIKRRPRPEPLVIPPPKPCTFIAPSIYPSITSYQSHLRSPVRTLDHPLILPPYTPPPILSPVREGTGLYFSTFLSSIAAGNQGLPPPPTPKTASKSLLRSASVDITPPVLPMIGEATPVSLEPRINIGQYYQAEIPELQDQILAQQDHHKATLLWLPLPEVESTPSQKERVDSLMNVACSSVLCGGGANVELMHHCLFENRGDIMKTLEMLLLKHPVFTRNHHLANYHYAGSDCWTVDEKRYFNKGITAYRKDFFLVQKLVRSKTVAQCVEFYYTYKKQVKVGRNGTLAYGPPDPEERPSETIPKQEQLEEAEENKQKVQTEEPKEAGGDHFKTMSHTLQVDKVLVLSIPKISSVDEAIALRQETKTPPSAPKSRPESTGKRSQPSAPSKSQGEPEGVFPCKKCSRVFYKVKSRSAHMKSHAEQEKKAAAAAQRQREEAEQAAAKARQEAAKRMDIEGEGGQDDSSEPEDERDEDWA